MGPSTHRLDLLLSAPRRDASPMAEDDMIAAFCSAQQLGQLLCLHADIFSYDSKVAQSFLVWLLKCAPNLVALDLMALNVPPGHHAMSTTLFVWLEIPEAPSTGKVKPAMHNPVCTAAACAADVVRTWLPLRAA